MVTAKVAKYVVFAGSVLCLFCLRPANSQADGPLGFPVPKHTTGSGPLPAIEEGRAASLGLPLTTKPSVKSETRVAKAPAPPPQKPAAQPKGVVDPEEFQLSPPASEQLFRVESEATSRERIRKAAEQRKIKTTEFPKDLPLPTVEKVERPVEAMLVATYASGAICYHPLYFEQPLPERYGFFVPLAQPILSAGKFYADTLVLPYRMALHRPWQWECSLPSLCR